MQHVRSLDSVVRARLRRWPQCPPGLGAGPKEIWLRGRPAEGTGTCQPFLKLPGSDRLRTLPDGLWLHFGGTPAEPFADIFAIEACSSIQNLLDKRYITAGYNFLRQNPYTGQFILANGQPGSSTEMIGNRLPCCHS